MNQEQLAKRARQAVRHFWRTRTHQQRRQGQATGKKDAGARSAVTGGAQLDGLTALIGELIADAGIAKAEVFFEQRKTTYLPGFFRPTKSWDLLAVSDGHLLARVEFKSQVGSFGNNFNNRAEESVGNAHDFWTAYRDGAFESSPRPWLGYFMLLENAPASTSPVAVNEPHFSVFDEFRDASYARRYEILCLKLLRERLYDGACLILSDRKMGAKGQYQEPNVEIGLSRFAASLVAHIKAHSELKA